jgi:hypothetical protein
MTPEELADALDINKFRAWLQGKGSAHVGETVSEYSDPLARFFYDQYRLKVFIKNDEIVGSGYVHMLHKPWSKKFVFLLRNNYAGHDWLNGHDALHILERAEKETDTP